MKPSIYKILLLLFCINFALVKAQDKKIDSLKNVLQHQKEDSNKVKSLLEVFDYYFGINDVSTALNYANLALNISQKISFKKGEGYSFLKIGQANYILNNFREAEKMDSSALNCFKEINFKDGIAMVYKALGSECYYSGNWPQSIKNTYQAVKLYEELGNKKEVAAGHFFVGFAYYWVGDYDHAYTSIILALKKYDEIGHDGHHGECYIYIANIYKIRKEYRAALSYDSIGLKMALAKNDRQIAANGYFSIADIISEQVEQYLPSAKDVQALASLNKASELYHKALSNFKAVKDPGGIGDCYGRLSETNIRLNRISVAQRYADSALSIAKEISFKDNLKTGYLVMSRVDSASGNFKDAFESYKTYILYRDSITNEENVKKSTETQMQYEFDKKETLSKAAQEKKDAETRRTRNLQYGAIAAFLVLAIFLYLNNRQKQKSKVKIEKAYSELKSTQAQLIQSEKMASLGELTAGIAHEIQNPLNFVNNFSEVNTELLREMNEEIEKENYTEVKVIAKDVIDNEQKINQHGKRADAIVKGMLQHSQASTGQKEPTDINKLADDYLRLSYQGFRAKDKLFNVTLQPDFDETIGKINIIPQDIGRVLLNLYNNAFYAVSEKKNQQGDNLPTGQAGYEPIVSIRTKKSGDKVLISVSDNGNGIPQKIVDKIFQPFFTTKPTGQGTGLGLSLAYDIIKVHGGEIKVKSAAGEGSEFVILLPVV